MPFDSHRPLTLNITRYRLTVFDEPRGEWRDTFNQAKRDAIRAGLASYDESRREYFLAVPVAIERSSVLTNE
jgi:hypothetical protein